MYKQVIEPLSDTALATVSTQTNITRVKQAYTNFQFPPSIFPDILCQTDIDVYTLPFRIYQIRLLFYQQIIKDVGLRHHKLLFSCRFGEFPCVSNLRTFQTVERITNYIASLSLIFNLLQSNRFNKATGLTDKNVGFTD